MSRTLYIDCFSGASGDMVLGALLDLGLPLDDLRRALGSLALDCGTVASARVVRAGIAATKFQATAAPPPPAPAAAGSSAHAHGAQHHHHDDSRHHAHDHHHDHPHDHHAHPHHSLAEIERAIDRSALPASGKARARELFGRIAEAEAAVHDMPIERVHLHEVGALDSIVDIVGAVFGMEWLGADRIVSSPINVGSGTVRCAHGVYPVPAPATARLLQGVPIYAGAVRSELTTPTGALLVSAYAESFGPMPAMTVRAIGYGAGDKDFPGHPNVLRFALGEEAGSGALERIVALECEIDDMNPQLFGPLMDRLYGAGALDVYYAPVQMKKGRPGTLVTVIAPPGRREALSGVLFTDTTTIGVRFHEMLRERLARETIAVSTPVGPVRFKVARREGTVVNAAPEFDDCARLAAERGLPIKDVQAIAVKAWLDRPAGPAPGDAPD